MKLLSRFKKGEKSDGADSQIIADSEEEGLLMPTPPAAESGGAAEGEASAAPAADDDLLAAAESDDGGEGEASAAPAADDDLLAAAESGDGAAEAEVDAEKSADADDDDVLSAFKTVEVYTDVSDLTKDIEEITIADLLELVREVRGMLPATPPEKEDAA